jgi:carboxyl-terminal processing protease
VGAEERDLEFQVTGLDGVAREVKVRTGSVVEPTVQHERMLDERRGIGYVTISSFTHETPGEFVQAFERLRAGGMRALVLDLRGNPGGVLSAAVEIAGRFLRDGLIVSTEGRGDVSVHRAEPAAAWWAGFPLVLLVDEGSASASEVLAGALQEHRAAAVVGSRTFGKGMVQTIHRFPEQGSVFKLTTSYYYTPSHKNLEHSADPTRERGLQPDLRVDLRSEERRAIHERLSKPSPPREALARIASGSASRT